MSVTDLIADQLTVIRNAVRAGKKTVIVKRSGTIEGIIKIVKDEGFIENYRAIEDNKQGQLKIYLKYLDDGTPGMETLKRVSKPGRRQYVPARKVRDVMGGVGIAILSTSKGLLTDREAKQQGVGGELICQIW
ncbi:MAG: 30S ribosomal protein S8 [Candidatus Makaraimicrobium thalassicum]|nr:MAG: 30S ribosomal protein S8 [Candidatus Omnitrophota bacterium]